MSCPFQVVSVHAVAVEVAVEVVLTAVVAVGVAVVAEEEVNAHQYDCDSIFVWQNLF